MLCVTGVAYLTATAARGPHAPRVTVILVCVGWLQKFESLLKFVRQVTEPQLLESLFI